MKPTEISLSSPPTPQAPRCVTVGRMFRSPSLSQLPSRLSFTRPTAQNRTHQMWPGEASHPSHERSQSARAPRLVFRPLTHWIHSCLESCLCPTAGQPRPLPGDSGPGFPSWHQWPLQGGLHHFSHCTHTWTGPHTCLSLYLPFPAG